MLQTLFQLAATWYRTQIGSPQKPGFWLAASVLSVIVATNLAWVVVHARAARRPVDWLRGWFATPALAWLLAALFLVLPPLGAWRAGAISPYSLGLTELDWASGLATGVPLAVVLLALVLVGTGAYHRACRVAPEEKAWRGAWRGPLEAILWQWHWAFYRAAAIGWLALPGNGLGMARAALQGHLGTDNAAWLVRLLTTMASGTGGGGGQGASFYWGAWLGLLFAGLEWWLDPFAWGNLRKPAHFERALRTAAMAIATTGLFALTRSFWLCLACHVAIELVLAVWSRAVTPGVDPAA